MPDAAPQDQNTSNRPPKRMLSARQAAHIYSVSEDWLRRQVGLRRVKIGRKLVRYDVDDLENFFRLRRVE